MTSADATTSIAANLRRQQRYRLLRQPDATLYVRTGWLRATAMAIKDVSNGGVSVYLERELAIASRVSIEYAAPNLTLNVNGVVAWCRARQDTDIDTTHQGDAYILGIELFSPMMLLSAFRDALPVHALAQTAF
ncbi:MAG: PilZ domain-containing protein [Pseudomonadota bacterium]|nr:PilZ domain-containing protein [Pseudomonadota bacterium]